MTRFRVLPRPLIIAMGMLLITMLALTACGGGKSAVPPKSSGSSGQEIDLTGAGASFPALLYEKWIDEYRKVNPNVRIEYQSIGSGGGIQQITNQTVDFGASDAPMSAEEMDKAPAKLLHIPTTMGSVALTYNIPNGPDSLNMTGQVLVDIFDGKITNWSDPAIVDLNPGVSLSDKAIAVVHRSDSSGTTFIFTSYLAAVSDNWQATKTPEWPTGIGAKGNEGVAGQISQTQYSFGYVELAYAVQNDLPVVALKNKAGNFVKPSLESTSKAAAGLSDSDPVTTSIVNAAGEDTYPIAAFTYLLVYQDMKDEAKARALIDFIDWALHDGQQYNEALLYAPLPDALVTRLEDTLATITANGQPIK